MPSLPPSRKSPKPKKDLVGAEDFRKKAVAGAAAAGVSPGGARGVLSPIGEDPAQAWAPAKLAAELDESRPSIWSFRWTSPLRLKEGRGQEALRQVAPPVRDRPKSQALKGGSTSLNATPIEIPSAPALLGGYPLRSEIACGKPGTTESLKIPGSLGFLVSCLYGRFRYTVATKSCRWYR